jgi:hypothetical protein
MDTVLVKVDTVLVKVDTVLVKVDTVLSTNLISATASTSAPAPATSPTNNEVLLVTTTTRDVMCTCGSAELYKMFCGRYDDKYLHHHDNHEDDIMHTTISDTTNNSKSSNYYYYYYEVEGSQHFDLVLRYLAAVHHQQKEELERVMDEIFRGVGGNSDGGSGGGGGEVFKAVYQDAQRYELRGLMAYMLTRLMVGLRFLMTTLLA